MQKQLKNLLKSLHLNESTISTILGALVVVIVGVLIFNYIQQTKNPAEITDEAVTQESQRVGEVEVEETEEGKFVPRDLPQVYEVKENESLWKIAESKYGSGYNWADIAQENELVNPDQLAVGQKLTLPKAEIKLPQLAQQKGGETPETIEGSSYTVEKGDHLWGIAVRAYGDGYKWPEIAEANEIANPDQIEIGQELKLPR